MEREIIKNFRNMDLELIETSPAKPGHQPFSERKASTTSQSMAVSRGRELNPALFGESANRSTGKPKVIEGSLQNELPHLMQNDQKLNDLKHQMSVMAENLGQLTQHMQEWARWAKTTDTKFDRVNNQLTKLEQNDHYIVNEAAQKFSQINTRFGERKSIDIKTQEMMDRHNSVLKSFEMRLTQLQRILAEKEAQLLATTAALNESKMEIARLKRM